jgi:hypothetical protein
VRMGVLVDFKWEDVGSVAVSTSGKLAFPELQVTPGVYCFRISSSTGDEIYIGQTDNLERRMQENYRYSSRPTNARVRAILMDRLATGDRIQLSVAWDIALEIDGEPIYVDLSLKHLRVLIESAALTVASQTVVKIHNL